MKLSKKQRMDLFLKRNYYTLTEIAEKCGVNASDILSLEKTQCIPGHTYELREINIFTCAGVESPLTENEHLITTYFYHSSIVNWINDALPKAKTIGLSALSTEVKNNFAKKLTKALGGIKTPGCESFEQAWRYWIDGTWGKCLKEISTDCLAKKELSRHCIAEIMKQDPLKVSEETRIQLKSAVENYISASLDFDAYGMRHILADEAINLFNLNIKYNREYLAE